MSHDLCLGPLSERGGGGGGGGGADLKTTWIDSPSGCRSACSDERGPQLDCVHDLFGHQLTA